MERFVCATEGKHESSHLQAKLQCRPCKILACNRFSSELTSAGGCQEIGTKRGREEGQKEDRNFGRILATVAKGIRSSTLSARACKAASNSTTVEAG